MVFINIYIYIDYMSFFSLEVVGVILVQISHRKISEGKAASTATLHRSGTTIITIKALRPYIYRGLPRNKILFTVPHGDRYGYKGGTTNRVYGRKKNIYIHNIRHYYTYTLFINKYSPGY